MKETAKDRAFRVLLSLALLMSLSGVVYSQNKVLTVQDMMAFEEIYSPVISNDGTWVALETRPDRGDGEVQVRHVDSSTSYTVERGSQPVFSRDAAWVAVKVEIPFLEREKRKNGKGNGPKPGMALVNLADGAVIQVERVEGFEFSENSQWLVYHRSKTEKNGDEKEADSETKEAKNKKKSKERTGRPLVLRHLSSAAETEILNVDGFSLDKRSRFVVYSIAVSGGESNGLYYREIGPELSDQSELTAAPNGRYTHLAWDEEGNRVGFLSSVDDEKGKAGPADLKLWDGTLLVNAVTTDQAPPGWMIPAKNQLVWSRDAERLYFGLKPEQSEEAEPSEEGEEEEVDPEDLYDVEKILEKREVDVWHWMDDRINPEQKKVFNRLRDRTYRAVYHLDSEEFVALADEQVPEVRASENGRTALGSTDIPHLRQTTWGESLSDLYTVDLKTGSKTKVVERLTRRRSTSISPSGRYVVYYKEKEWWLYDENTGQSRSLTAGLKVAFHNEDHDYPSSVPSYGSAGWVSDDSAVLIYDKYDIWEFPVAEANPVNLTGGKGRRDKTVFRMVKTDPKALHIEEKQRLLLSSYHDLEKYWGFYEATEGRTGVRLLLDGEKRFRFIAKAKDSDRLLYTRESYSEFPDLWTADSSFSQPVKATDVNPQVGDFAWGSAELVQWNSLDGTPLQGILIKPGNYVPGKRYPVLVYFYRFFSQRLHEFNQVVVNHRPCFPFYASNGYAVFLPDIRFEVGSPGFAATKSLVPGVQKLIDMGVADPEAVGLHGHSWSGYQTAFIVTQTDLFAAAVAGAPVSNMTSAYGGIRWASGKARQFQYEKTQSRIGGSLWENLQEYIENSPVFYADRINTPMLIEFGDEDGAVPWYQGIELYLAMRRLDKECVFLQYRGEPHHLQKYPNKLDYTLKMKEYFDHYLKGEPAPDWMTKGVPYNGK